MIKYFNKLLVSIFLFIILMTQISCELSNNSKIKSNLYNINNNPAKPVSLKNINENCTWDRMISNFNLERLEQHKNVQEYVQKYGAQKYHLRTVSRYAGPYLFHIVQELEQRGLPGELALLPMIESAYKPKEISEKGAAGIWQLADVTGGKRYGLKKDLWYDGRHDIIESTNIALDYLAFLNKTFDGDWLLSLAAYNAGEGRVKKAIAKNKAIGKPCDFWNLSLPEQTRTFVPKLLAIAYIIQNAEQHEIQLNPIENKPYFEQIEVKHQISLQFAAKLANIHPQEIKQLNPALKRNITHPKGPHIILLPSKNVVIFNENLAKLTSDSNVHIIQKGDTLEGIANKYNTSVNEIKIINSLNSNLIIHGKKLKLP